MSKSEAYDRLHEYAEKASPEDVQKIREKLSGMNRGPIMKIWDDVLSLWKMIVDPNASWTSKAIAIGAVLYLVSPLDGVPDLLPLIGLTDDAAVILAAVATLAFELKKYRDAKMSNTVDGKTSQPAAAAS
ncbi:YkvA family protein [Bremerella sp. P1]|uniref:YkvA family protein n=1 Tax=Bremerella sp. P1 TaxID=3026424 RepID=UPI00236849BA|nr:YkvA family protein [Bremerella sp. P1]WDI43319.1 YkvA family protein [Bremerella sp. P1]